MKKISFLFVIAFLAYSLIAQSAENNFSKQYAECMNKSLSTQDMIECIGSEYKKQDIKLNNAYKDLQQNLSSERKKQLLEAQRLWIKYRDANCNFYYDPDGGSLARLSANECMLSSTAQRAKELENLKNN